MATVQLADIYQPNTFNRRTQERQTEANAFIASGVAAQDPVLATQLAAGGQTGELPMYNGITIKEPNYSTDNPATLAVPGKIAGSVQKFRSAPRNDHWSTMDLARELADSDPMAAITGRIGSFWATDDEKRIINSLVGVKADNIANDGSDMVYSVATDGAGAITDAERISSTALALASQTLGDRAPNLTAIAMHSALRTRLAINDLIQPFKSQDGVILFETYLGKRIVVDDSLAPVAGTNRLTYTAILFGAGVISWANGPVQTPSELTREALAGNGGGQSIVSSRTNSVFHPNGFSYVGTPAGQSATYAELATATHWNRVVARKSVDVAFLEVNE